MEEEARAREDAMLAELQALEDELEQRNEQLRLAGAVGQDLLNNVQNLQCELEARNQLLREAEDKLERKAVEMQTIKRELETQLIEAETERRTLRKEAEKFSDTKAALKRQVLEANVKAEEVLAKSLSRRPKSGSTAYVPQRTVSADAESIGSPIRPADGNHHPPFTSPTQSAPDDVTSPNPQQMASPVQRRHETQSSRAAASRSPPPPGMAEAEAEQSQMYKKVVEDLKAAQGRCEAMERHLAKSAVAMLVAFLTHESDVRDTLERLAETELGTHVATFHAGRTLLDVQRQQVELEAMVERQRQQEFEQHQYLQQQQQQQQQENARQSASPRVTRSSTMVSSRVPRPAARPMGSRGHSQSMVDNSSVVRDRERERDQQPSPAEDQFGGSFAGYEDSPAQPSRPQPVPMLALGNVRQAPQELPSAADTGRAFPSARVTGRVSVGMLNRGNNTGRDVLTENLNNLMLSARQARTKSLVVISETPRMPPRRDPAARAPPDEDGAYFHSVQRSPADASLNVFDSLSTNDMNRQRAANNRVVPIAPMQPPLAAAAATVTPPPEQMQCGGSMTEAILDNVDLTTDYRVMSDSPNTKRGRANSDVAQVSPRKGQKCCCVVS